MNQSRALTQFYRDYYAWIMSMMYGSAMNPHNFTKRSGLCSNVYNWVYSQENPVVGLYDQLFQEMRAQFVAAGLNQILPFNEPTDTYGKEKIAGTAHLNTERLNWVKEHAQI